MKTAELTGNALDWAVAQAEGLEYETAGGEYTVNDENDENYGLTFEKTYSPSADWALGGPIIERELIQINPKYHNETIAVTPKPYATVEGWHWEAYVLGPENLDDNFFMWGDTPLEAAMRCYVASKLGDEVEIPDELLNPSLKEN